MARGMHHIDPQLSEHDGLAIAQAQIDEWRGACLMHGDGHMQPAREPACRREVIRMSVRVDCITDAQAVTRGESEIAVDLTQLGVDKSGRAAVAAPNEIRAATARGDLFEQHDGLILALKLGARMYCAEYDLPPVGETMAARFANILETIGRTPVVRLNRLAPAHLSLYVKLEAFNPMGSVKDRLALGVIEDAERRGTLRPGQTIIEATSGNTGIGLAMVCAQKGYPLVVTMAENFSVERRKLMRFLGAKVVLTPAAAKGSGMLAKAVELAETHGWFLCRQFENEANADVHSRTTAPEILAAFEGERLDYWVTGFGTGGT